MTTPGLRLRGILETVLYCAPDERESVEAFYSGLLGAPEVASWEDGTAFRIGSGVLLIFDIEKLAERESPMSAHGASGPGHVCFVVEGGQYEAWSARLRESEVEIVHEQTWSDELRSFYFRDPAGNLLEIAEGDIWPPARPGLSWQARR